MSGIAFINIKKMPFITNRNINTSWKTDIEKKMDFKMSGIN
jgi:hypothetical protein